MSTVSSRQIGLFFFYLFLSFIIVAFGQPAWFGVLGFFAAFIGYALFWKAMFFFEKRTHQFALATLWFAAVQCLQLSWMTSYKYQGPYILIVYGFLSLAIGLQFGLLSWFIAWVKPLSWLRMLAIASLWVIFEWLRLYFISGFGWNPVGMALSSHHFSMQLAVIWGVYGLSFWVVFVNLLGFRALFLKRSSLSIGVWIALAAFPYFFGYVHQHLQKTSFKNAKPLSVVLVQTALSPEQKRAFPPFKGPSISPFVQWFRILEFVKSEKRANLDLIVLPEGALPFGAFRPMYFLDEVRLIWEKVFGPGSAKNFPPIQEPYAFKNTKLYGDDVVVSNIFWAQALANQYEAEVILGLDKNDQDSQKSYNSAFFFKPHNTDFLSYEKRVLVPLGEYIPYKWAKGLAKRFGITDSFSPGELAKLFIGKLALGISICNEETYPYLLRSMRKMGADFFVNISNDVWFPESKLPDQHFEHGRLRAVENGVSVVRSCNTGITGAVDCFGRIIKKFDSDLISTEHLAGAIFIQVPTQNYKTLYTFWGDKFILSVSLFFILLSVLGKRSKI